MPDWREAYPGPDASDPHALLPGYALGYGGFAQYGGDKNQRYTNSFSGPNDHFQPADVKYFNWRFIMRNNVDASAPASPSLDAFFVSYRLD